MNLMNKLERKWGRYAIYDLHKYFVFAYMIGFALKYLPVDLEAFLCFNMDAILHGQIWRIFTWICCGASDGIFTILFMLCLIPMGRTLERFLGTFRMNVYLIGGVLLNIIGGALVYLVSFLVLGQGISIGLTMYYILLSTFMALAICMPDATVNLYFILPIKMKWMLVVYVLELLYELFIYYTYGGIIIMAMLGSCIIFALLNLVLFFYFAQIRLTRKQRKRQREFRAQMNSAPRPGSGITRHKCAICGKTELDDPNMTFRYCSKCTGNKEYCQEHLFTHTHN